MTRYFRLTIPQARTEGDNLTLTPEQHHYLGHVLRLGPRANFIAMNGQGQAWLAELSLDTHQATLIHPLDQAHELPIDLVLCIAILRNNALDQVIHQATELGVKQIYPILTARSLPAPSSQKLTRWQRIAQEAAEQSERLYVPQITTPQAWTEVLKLGDPLSRKYICSLGEQIRSLVNQLADQQETSREIWLAVGPEAGWTETEQELARAANWYPVSLGTRTLRAITAAIVGLGLIANHPIRQT
ncbi:16S rRNA (uracil(1498)-N(3))-methyltransferase [Synechococcus sp. PCC 6312]|uniref:RsmE family RNA methyltransferase n=1 Tax=Synechococcus sp. (strain ATCC 27167 / PCC 6312) TaxID=195253 RepID=UPI00029F318E|nr:RsmE family RNA methyltransferase [Synechococcus sp. PCC 6312]AFY60887.1 RNA methyltransferase, RsmE family [Synechococcus sp. PCC 6312]